MIMNMSSFIKSLTMLNREVQQHSPTYLHPLLIIILFLLLLLLLLHLLLLLLTSSNGLLKHFSETLRVDNWMHSAVDLTTPLMQSSSQV